MFFDNIPKPKKIDLQKESEVKRQDKEDIEKADWDRALEYRKKHMVLRTDANGIQEEYGLCVDSEELNQFSLGLRLYFEQNFLF